MTAPAGRRPSPPDLSPRQNLAQAAEVQLRSARVDREMGMASRNSGILVGESASRQFRCDSDAQGWERLLDGVPHERCSHLFVIMPIDISRRRHLLPGNRGVSRFHLLGQSPGCFGDDFETTRHGVDGPLVCKERIFVEAVGESACQVDISNDVAQRRCCTVKRHISRPRLRRADGV